MGHDARVAAGLSALEGGQLEEAERFFTEALQKDPQQIHALTGQGRVRFNQGRYWEAKALFEQARQQDASLLGPLFFLALTLGKLGFLNEPVDLLREALSRVDAPIIRQSLAQELLNQGRLAEAEQEFQRLQNALPVVATVGLAMIQERYGAHAQAEAMLEPLLTQADSYPNIAFVWATVAKHLGRPAEALPVVDLALRASDHPSVRSPLLMVRGQIKDRLKDYDGAFEDWTEAHQLEGLHFDARQHFANIEQIRSFFSEGFQRRLPNSGQHGENCVLIVGVPRSGTSLIEQILACHSQVKPGGERDDLRQISLGFAISKRGNWPAAWAQVERNVLAKAAQDYRAGVGAETVITDKMPHNFLYLGVWALLFPKAKIIYCQRNPMDLAISAYQASLLPSHAWTRRQEWIAAYWLSYQHLMKHWRKVLPNPILEVSYEELVRKPAQQIPQLLSFCGLPWEPACLEPHLNTRYQSTASYEQIRHPIHPGSVGRWQHYAKHLQPMQDSLQRAGIKLT